MGSKSGIDGVIDVAITAAAGNVTPSPYASPDGRRIAVTSNMGVLFSDGFGGAAIDTVARWDVVDGGLGANPTLHGQSLTQGAIGSGTSMLATGSAVVGASALTVHMGTTNGAEYWLLSQQAFAGAEDVTILLSKSQAITANSIFVGLVEVDPQTLIPVNNAAGASYTQGGNPCPFPFTNAGGVELGMTATATAYACVAIEDGSPAAAIGSVGVATANLSATSEFLIEFHAEDLLCSNATVDSAAARNATISRVSTQVPNDGRVYKLLIRFRNVSATGLTDTAVVIQRVVVIDSQELRVEVASGRGDATAQKAMAVNVVGTVPISSGTLNVVPKSLSSGGLAVATTTNPGNRLAAAASGFFKASAGQLYAYDLLNTTASVVYLQLYAKATAGVPGTDTPSMTIPLAANGAKVFSSDIGFAFATGIAWAATTDAAGATPAGAGAITGSVGFA